MSRRIVYRPFLELDQEFVGLEDRLRLLHFCEALLQKVSFGDQHIGNRLKHSGGIEDSFQLHILCSRFGIRYLKLRDALGVQRPGGYAAEESVILQGIGEAHIFPRVIFFDHREGAAQVVDLGHGFSPVFSQCILASVL